MTASTAPPAAGSATVTGSHQGPRPGRGLSGKLLLLTVLFVMIAEVLIFVPSVANMRMRWLQDKLSTAASASLVIEGFDEMDLPEPVETETLMSTGTKAIVLRRDGASRLIASADMPTEVDGQYDLAAVGPAGAMIDAFDTLFFGGDRLIRVFGPVGESQMVIEVVMEERPLRDAMLVYARNVLFLSLIISFITAGLVFFAINRLMIRPIRRLTRSMEAFAEHPENPDRVIIPRGSDDELGEAEDHLAAMQRQLQRTLKQQKNLADLGLAVSKINHDMRNILASAHLMSDRLAGVDDPVVKRFAPKLLRTIDRAVAYSGEVLAYGRAREAEPKRRWVDLTRLVEDVRDLVMVEPQPDIAFVVDVEPGLEVEADSEQLFRVIHNLVRNAFEALRAMEGDSALVRRITLTARRSGSVVTILVDDTGPGMPAEARANLFTAFKGSARSGGTGLGLAIARELVTAHGGTLELVDKPDPGTAFRIVLPDQPVSMSAFRARKDPGDDSGRHSLP
ncbi:sensor histidine kinase [Pararhizobium haloflavum]|uniref:sensor histidine kinase n=1 Tax=Pararhizobium haloflavum TaxID=2037914 RepID=UPI000C186326|nr:HAMP domain-containing sensor histidine kinase [Pararhizobium haloflavum]